MRIITRNSLGKTPLGTKPAGKKKGLSLRLVDDYLKFVLFLALIGLAYVWNSHQAEKKIKLESALETQVESLKARYLLKQSTLSAGTRLSEIQAVVDTLGLRPQNEPVFKLVQGKTLAEVEAMNSELDPQQLQRQIDERQ
ncbi:MAG: FtsL-like putative cell division protein [Bacteroidota bacterium]